MINTNTNTNTNTNISSFIIFIIILLLTTMVDTSLLIRQTCKKSSMDDPTTIKYSFCINAFRTAPSSRHANLTRLGLISINLVKHNVNSTTSLIRFILGGGGGNTKVDSRTKAGLRDCLELYSDALPTLRETARDYRATRFNVANLKVSSVMEASSTCEHGFQDVGVASPLSKHNNDTFELSAIALSIMNML